MRASLTFVTYGGSAKAGRRFLVLVVVDGVQAFDRTLEYSL